MFLVRGLSKQTFNFKILSMLKPNILQNSLNLLQVKAIKKFKLKLIELES